MRYLTLLLLALLTACGSAAGDITGTDYFPDPATGGSTWAGGGDSPIETGGFAGSSGGSGTGGQPATGGSPIGGASQATGGSSPATGGSFQNTGGSSRQTGGSPQSGAQTTGGQAATGGAPLATGGTQTGGSSTGGTPQPAGCQTAYQAGVDYPIGRIVRQGTGYFLCTGPDCQKKSPAEDEVYAWRRTTCTASCACDVDCNAPTAGYQVTSTGKVPWTAYPEYMEAIQQGWQIRVQRADSCAASGACLYYEDYALMTCTGTTEDCRKYDPRFESCTGALGSHPPCRDVAQRPTSPWLVVLNKCPA